MAKKKVKKDNTEKIINTIKKDYKKNYFLLIIAVLIIIAVFAGIALLKPVVKEGSTVTFDYIGAIDGGIVFDTSIEAVGKESNLEKDSYAPLTLTLGQGSLIPGFEKALIGMKKGQTKKITLTPEEAYGLVKDELILKELKRKIRATRYSIVSRSVFESAFSEKPEIGKIIERQEIPWQLKVSKLNETSVILEGIVKIGDEIILPGVEWKTQIIEVTEKEIVLYQNPIMDTQISFPTEQGLVFGKVVRIDDNTFDVDTNHPLAGKTLIFDITLNEISEKSDD